MMLRHSTVVLGMIAFATGPAGAQRARGNADSPGFRTLLTVDSAVLGNPFLSSDGKWVLFTQAGRGGTSVWMASAANPKPFRITSDGYRDIYPVLSPTGDRVFFGSNRPNRDPKSTAGYIMSIPIDKVTGRPTGPVQQVTTDSGVRNLPPLGLSPDGKWLAYVIPAESATVGPRGGVRGAGLVRLVPANGGNARTLATKFTYSGITTSFSADGQRVLFQDSVANLLREVSINGGAVTTLYRAAKNELLHNVPFRDDRYVVFDSAAKITELRDRNGRSLGVVPTSSVSPATGGRIRDDGRGVIGVSNERGWGLRRISLTTGTKQEVIPLRYHSPIGVAADGSILMNTSKDTGPQVIATFSPAGKLQHEVKLDANLRGPIQGLVKGTSRVLMFGPGYPHTPSMNAYGFDRTNYYQPAYLVDPSTGVKTLVADSVWQTCCHNNGMMWDDVVAGIVQRQDSTVDLKAIAPTGTTHLVRSFPFATYRRFYTSLDIYGTRLAYADSISKDESAVLVTTGPESSAARIATVGRGAGVEFRWSADGRKLAVAHRDARDSSRAMVRIFKFSADGSLTGAGPVLDLGGMISYIYSVRWLPDASALMVVVDEGQCYGCPVIRPLDPARPSVRPMSSDGDNTSEYYIEPSGKSILEVPFGYLGHSIWTREFLPVKKP